MNDHIEPDDTEISAEQKSAEKWYCAHRAAEIKATGLELIEQSEFCARLLANVQLTHQERFALVSYYLDGLSLVEIAAVLGVCPSTASTIKRTALLKARWAANEMLAPSNSTAAKDYPPSIDVLIARREWADECARHAAAQAQEALARGLKLLADRRGKNGVAHQRRGALADEREIAARFPNWMPTPRPDQLKETP